MTDSKRTMPSILFENICLSFEDKVLFDDLSFSVATGKCTCILGPSGCGKSTLLRLASGNTTIPYSGNIAYPTASNEVGWMSQDDLLLPWMCVLDNVLLGAKLRGEVSEELRSKAKNLLEEAGLANYHDALPRALSGGMRQRTALLRTLMEERPVLLMDEPFSALDALTRLKLQNLAAKMTRGKTVLLVTHDPMEALRMGHQIIVFSGTPASATYVKALKGTPPHAPNTPQMAQSYTNLLATLMNGDSI